MKNLMASIVTLIVLIAITSITYADVKVKGYYKSNFTYTQPHYRSNPDGKFYNNYSSYGNVNPHTGKVGTKKIKYYNSDNLKLF